MVADRLGDECRTTPSCNARGKAVGSRLGMVLFTDGDIWRYVSFISRLRQRIQSGHGYPRDVADLSAPIFRLE